MTKVVKGGKQMSFRAVVAVGDDKGKVQPSYVFKVQVTISVQLLFYYLTRDLEYLILPTDFVTGSAMKGIPVWLNN